MDPIAIASIASSVGLPLLGQWLSGGADAEADRLTEEAVAAALGLSVPAVRELKPQLLTSTHLKDIITDPRFDAAQDAAMARLQEIGSAGGLDARARGQLEESRLEAGSQAKANRDAILLNARSKGTAGTGEELSALLQADQAAADRERMAGISALSDAEQRTLEAIMAAGSMGAQRQAQQFQQRAQVATAQDAIDEFNARVANDFTLANNDNTWRQFDAQMGLTALQNDARYRQAGRHERKADKQRQMIGGIGQGATYGLAGYQQSGMVGGAPRAAAAPPPAAQTSPARPVTQQQAQPGLTPEQARTRRKVG